jgi:hypothetical protein
VWRLVYHYLVIDDWSRKVVAWDVAEREDPIIAADLVGRACIRERIIKGRKQPLILHPDNGNAMRAVTLESRLEELGVLRSFSRPRVLNDNPYSESLFRTAKFRPDYPVRPFASAEDVCLWVVSFVDWYNHRHRHSGLKFVTPHHGTAARPWRSACTGVSPKSRPGSGIRAAGHAPFSVGLNQKWLGSTRHHQKTNSSRLRFSWLPEQQQGCHLSWQSPLQPPDLLEQLTGSIQQLSLPLAHLDGMDAVIGADFLDCLAATDRLHGALALNSGLRVRRLLIGGSPSQVRHPASMAKDETCPQKPVHLKVHG